jgi:hypothetical protein
VERATTDTTVDLGAHGDSTAITGGAGAFRRARGEMRLHARSATSFDFMYRIVR